MRKPSYICNTKKFSDNLAKCTKNTLDNGANLGYEEIVFPVQYSN